MDLRLVPHALIEHVLKIHLRLLAEHTFLQQQLDLELVFGLLDLQLQIKYVLLYYLIAHIQFLQLIVQLNQHIVVY